MWIVAWFELHGLIPARAGKTRGKASPLRAQPAHPRAGGENVVRENLCRNPSGSSPRGRGKHSNSGIRRHRLRLIPARAGKTWNHSTTTDTAAAHPRAGGENDLTEPIIELMPGSSRAGGENIADPLGKSTARGSSPRGRGKHQALRTGMGRGRLIPARAGKTESNGRAVTHSGAHPRAGGENPASQMKKEPLSGSSPRGRGKPKRLASNGVWSGLIPARAGKTTRSWITVADEGAHPRAGGENLSFRPYLSRLVGSSPRGRGKPTVGGAEVREHGLIPARAGKTPPPRRTGTAPGAHPRAGGENCTPGTRVPVTQGSSPRGRGKPDRLQRREQAPGLIPARAGKTR